MTAYGVFADRGDGIAIGREIPFGIGFGPCGLAQHIEAGGKSAIVLSFHALHGFFDIAAHDEDLPHQTHRCAHRLTDERLASARH